MKIVLISRIPWKGLKSPQVFPATPSMTLVSPREKLEGQDSAVSTFTLLGLPVQGCLH